MLLVCLTDWLTDWMTGSEGEGALFFSVERWVWMSWAENPFVDPAGWKMK